jgi:uncharacterized protein
LPLHLEKKAIRALGVAESFSEKDSRSTLAGVVMRSDLVVDGFAIGSLLVSGFDATNGIARLARKLRRNDLNAVFLSGSILSLYNIVDVDLLSSKLDLPIVALTFKRSGADIERNIRTRFSPPVAAKKIRMLKKLGIPKKLKLDTGYPIYVRSADISFAETVKALNKFTLQGSVPEPVRLARLLARVVANVSEPKKS